MLILNIVILIAASGFIGYYVGKGNIVVNRKMSKAAEEEYLAMQRVVIKNMEIEKLEQKKRVDEYNTEMNKLIGGV